MLPSSLGIEGPKVARFRRAYLRMAREAKYRPQAPSNGFTGDIALTKQQLADPIRLKQEATKYALQFNAEEDTLRFQLGCSDFPTNMAFVWTVEAARALCGARPDLAFDLLLMAVKEIRHQTGQTEDDLDNLDVDNC
jgi:hypothetical protein